MEEARKAYKEMIEMINAGEFDCEKFVEIGKRYATLKQRFGNPLNGLNLTFVSGDRTYTMRNSLSEIKSLKKSDYIRFAEDITMMIYKFTGGTEIGYTPKLIEEINKSLPELKGDK